MTIGWLAGSLLMRPLADPPRSMTANAGPVLEETCVATDGSSRRSCCGDDKSPGLTTDTGFGSKRLPNDRPMLVPEKSFIPSCSRERRSTLIQLDPGPSFETASRSLSEPAENPRLTDIFSNAWFAASGVSM